MIPIHGFVLDCHHYADHKHLCIPLSNFQKPLCMSQKVDDGELVQNESRQDGDNVG